MTNKSEEESSRDWFDNVENIRPLRGGRRADTLNEVATGTTKVTVEEAERKFLAEFEGAASQEDPLQSMCNFITWFEEHFPSGQNCFYPMLYKICTTFCETQKNDERLLKMWLKLAENSESGLAIMEFVFAKGSCRELARFYVRWSQMYQSIGWWNKAREKLQLGLRMHATPVDLLHGAIDELEYDVMRVTSYNGDSEDEDNFSIDETMEITRETLGKLRGLGHRHFAPIVRAAQTQTHSQAQVPLSDSQTSKKRGNQDQFEIFCEESLTTPAQGPSWHLFQTPIGTRQGKKSRIVDSLRDDQYYQTLFGTFDLNGKVNLQLTNEENELKTIGVASSRLPSIPAHTPAQPTFDIFREDGDEQHNTRELRRKAKLELRKDYVRSMSVEEGFAKRIQIENRK